MIIHGRYHTVTQQFAARIDRDVVASYYCSMTIRTAHTTDLDFFVECVTHEGWLSETRFGFEVFFAHDPNGCFVAEADQQRLGMCVATPYGTCGFLGELIVVPAQRGHGLGTHLMKHAIAYLQSRGCQSIYLDGDLPAVPIYEKLGFRAVTRSLRFLGKIEGQRSEGIHPIKPTELSALIESDLSAFGADRSFFLKRRVKLFPDLCLVQMISNKPAGFIMGQPGNGVVTVGPWLVQDASTHPVDLLLALAAACGDRKLRIGVLESNHAATMMLRSLISLTETDPCLRMVLGPDTGLGVSTQLLAVGSPAKG
jgi:ribosomal protein S18 acetylase RimI-like enzyme